MIAHISSRHKAHGMVTNSRLPNDPKRITGEAHVHPDRNHIVESALYPFFLGALMAG